MDKPDNIAIVNQHGIITLPKEVREKLGLHPGSCLDVTIEDGKIVLIPLLLENEREFERQLSNSRDSVSELIRGRREDDAISVVKFGC